MSDECKSELGLCTKTLTDSSFRRHSKDYITDLENQVKTLKQLVAKSQPQLFSQNPELDHPLPRDQEQAERDLQEETRPCSAKFDNTSSQQAYLNDLSQPSKAPKDNAALNGTSPGSDRSESLITRLCGIRGRLNSNDAGQLRYFGPTSSLHLTESVTSIFGYCNDVSRPGADFEKEIPWAMQQYLLGLYWKFQHTVLQIVHKEAFLAGMEVERGPYFSRCLLLCLLTSGARISASPEVRNLSIPADDDDTGERPVLTRLAEEALEKELLNPGLTTIQSLMLMSIMDCCQSKDSKGWMKSGKSSS